MRYTNIETGIEIVRKVDAKAFTVTAIEETGAKLQEIVPEGETREPEMAVLTAENAEFFRFVKNHNPLPEPEAMVEDGKLIVAGKKVAMGNAIIPDAVVGVAPGEVLFTANRKDGFADLYKYVVREDRLAQIGEGWMEPKMHRFGTLVVLTDNRTEVVEVIDEETKKPKVDENGQVVTETRFIDAQLFQYTGDALMNGTGCDEDDYYDDEEDEDEYDEYDEPETDGIMMNAPITGVKLVAYADYETIVVTCDEKVEDGVVLPSDATQVYLIPVRRFKSEDPEVADSFQLRAPQYYCVKGKNPDAWLSVDERGRVSFTLRTDEEFVYTNAGHRKRVVTDADCAQAIAGYPTFLGIWFEKGGSVCTLSYGNAAQEVKRVRITETEDRGTLYTIV